MKKRLVPLALFLIFFALVSIELAGRWRSKIEESNDSVLYVRSISQESPSKKSRPSVNLDKLINANRNRETN